MSASTLDNQPNDARAAWFAAQGYPADVTGDTPVTLRGNLGTSVVTWLWEVREQLLRMSSEQPRCSPN